jgi:hypothetical protein
MKQSKRVLRFILSLPFTTIAAILNAESDWIRYGLPAVLLTAIFFFAMRFVGANIEAPPVRPPTGARQVAPPGAISFSDSALVRGDRPKMPYDNLEPGVRVPQRSTAPAAAERHGQPATDALSEQQTEGRRALCSAVGYVLRKVKKKHRKTKALAMAIEVYRGQGGPQAADRAVSGALEDYGRGRWDEDQCPPAVGGTPLPKGAIGEAVR